MAKNIENHIAKLELDYSGFLKGAEKVLKAIDRINEALTFKGAEKGVNSFARSMTDTFGKLSGSIQKSFSSAAEAVQEDLNSIVSAARKCTDAVAISFADTMDAVLDSSVHAAGAFSDSFGEMEDAAGDFSGAFSKYLREASHSADEIAAGLGKNITGKIEKLTSDIAASSDTLQKLQDEFAETRAATEQCFSDMAYGAALSADSVAMLEQVSQQAFDSVTETARNAATEVEQIFGSIPADTAAQKIAVAVKTEANAATDEAEETVNDGMRKIALAAGIAGTGVLTAAAFLLRHHDDKIHDALEAVAKKAAKVFGGVKEDVTRAVSKIAAEVTKHINLVKAATDSIRDALKTAFPATMELIGDEVDKTLTRIERRARETANVLRWLIGLKPIDIPEEPADEAAKAMEQKAEKAKAAAEANEKLDSSIKNVLSALATLTSRTVDAKTATTGLAGALVALSGGNIDGALNSLKNLGKEMTKGFSSNNIDDVAKSVTDFGNAFTTAMGGKVPMLDKLSKLGAFNKALAQDLKTMPKRMGDVAEKSSLVGKVLEKLGVQSKEGLKTAAKSFAKGVAGLSGEDDNALMNTIGRNVGLFAYRMRQSLKEKLHGTEEPVKATEIAMNALSKTTQAVGAKFSALGAVGFAALQRITNKAMAAGEQLIKSLSVEQIAAGWQEYGLKINSTQVIMESTGESLTTVNKALEELNQYADRTIYSFSDMTSNIGKFTNAGVDLDTAVAAMKGISNEAALSGANAQEASRAMYNFAQALSSGAVKLIDWKSIENANMATKGFKEQLIETAVELGTLKKSGEDYISVTTDANGHTAEAFNATKKFNDSLSSQWMTTDVLTKTLAKYADETTDFGKKAYAAAQDVKTGAQLMDTLKEAAGSGWARTFELVIGNLDEAKRFWTGINNLISPVLDAISDARNGLLGEWRAFGGRESLLESLKTTAENLIDILKAARKGFETFLPPMTGERLKEITDKIGDFIAKIRLSDAQLEKVRDIFGKTGTILGNIKSLFAVVSDRIGGLLKKSSSLKDFRGMLEKIFGTDILSKNGLLDGLLTLTRRIAEFTGGGIIGKIHAVFDAIEGKAGNGSHLQEGLSTIGGVLGNAFTSLADIGVKLVDILTVIGEAVKPLWTSLAAYFPVLFDMLNGAIDLLHGVTDVVVTLVDKYIRNWLVDLLPKIGATVLKAAASVLDLIAKLASAIGEFLSRHADGFAKFIKSLITFSSVLKGIKIAVKTGLGIARLVNTVKALTGAFRILLPVLRETKTFELLSGWITGTVAPTIKSTLAMSAWTAAAAAGVAAVIMLIGKIKEELESQKEQAQACVELTDRQKELIEGSKKLREEYADNAEEHRRTVENVNDEAESTRNLVQRLRDNVDATGKVKDGKEELVQNVMDRLNQQLGLELELVDGQVTNYEELNKQLDETIEKKRLLGLIESGEEEYNAAKKNLPEHTTLYENAKKEREADEAELESLTKYVMDLAPIHNNMVDRYAKKHPAEDVSFLRLTEGMGVDDFVKTLADPFNRAILLMMSGSKEEIETNTLLYDTALKMEKVAENLEGDGTEDKPGLRKTEDEYRKALAADQSVIRNYNRMYNAYWDDRIPTEEKTKSAAAYEWGLNTSPEATEEELKAQVDAMYSTVQGYLDQIKRGMLAFDDPIYQSATDALAAARELYKEATSTAEDTADEVEKKLTGRDYRKPVGDDMATYTGTVDKEKVRASTAANRVKNATEEPLKNLDTKTPATNAMNDLSGAIGDGEDDSADSMYSVVQAVLGVLNLEEVSSRSFKYAKTAVDGLIAGISETKGITKLIEAARHTVGLIVNVFKSVIQPGSPSKVTTKLGVSAGDGLVAGMEQTEKAVREESRTLSETLVDGMTPLARVRDVLSGAFDDAMTITPVLDLSALRGGTDTMRGMLDGAFTLPAGGMDISGMLNATVTPDENDRMLREVQGLRRDMAAFNERLSRMQVRMDTGALVGELRDPMDRALGERAAFSY